MSIENNIVSSKAVAFDFRNSGIRNVSNIKAIIEIKFDKMIQYKFKNEEHTYETIKGVFDTAYSNTEFNDLLIANKKYIIQSKIVIDYTKNVLPSEDIPAYIKKFKDYYISNGVVKQYYRQRWEVTDHNQYIKSEMDLSKIKEWYQNLKITPQLPKYVYRGISLNTTIWGRVDTKRVTRYKKFMKQFGKQTPFKSMNFIYQHYDTYPISTSTSIVVAQKFFENNSINADEKGINLLLRFEIDKDGVIIDTRLLDTKHNNQTEIILDPLKSYNVKIMDIYKAIIHKQLIFLYVLFLFLN